MPWKFTVTNAHSISEIVKLVLRTGYVKRVTYNRTVSKLVGMQQLYLYMGLTGGEILLFDYRNASTFSLHVMGKDGGEISYPSISHSTGESSNIQGTEMKLKLLVYTSFMVSVL